MSLTSAFQASVHRNFGKTALVFGDNSWTFAEFDRLSGNVAQRLVSAGVKPGDRVALHLLNGPEFAMAAIGCLRAGALVVPVNTRLKGREIDFILRHSGTAFFIADSALYAEVAGSCPAIEEISVRYFTGPAAEGTSSFSELLQSPARPVSLPATSAQNRAAILYTSGTTAHPKGVVHTHGTLLETALVMRQMHLNEDQVVILMSSMAHMIGFAMLFLSALLNGATTVITRPLDFEAALDAFAKWRGTYSVTLPVVLRCLLQLQSESPRELSSARYIFCGGDSPSPSLQEECRQAIGPVCEAYGSTEIAPSCWNPPGEARIGSLGKPGAGTEFRIMGGHGLEQPPGAVGELQIRGPHLMSGYWQDPESTRSAFQDGWFRSGDLAWRDNDGYYWFAGRKKEIIVRGGSNISPQEVEAVLCEHAAVSEAAVVGRKDPLWGEVVVAHVVPHAGVRIAAEQLLAFAREKLADYKVPVDVVFHSELPKSAAGKIHRRALREDADCQSENSFK